MTREGNPEGFDQARAAWQDLEPWNEGVEFSQNQLQKFAVEQVEYASYWLVPPRHRRYLLQPDRIHLLKGDFAEGRGGPVRVEKASSGNLFIYFDEETYDEHFASYAPAYGLTEETMAKLYIGVGVTLHLLNSRKQSIPADHRAELAHMFSEPYQLPDRVEDSLDEAIQEATHDFTPYQIHELRLSIAHLNEGWREYLNHLRFAIGLLVHTEERLLGSDSDKQQSHDLVQTCRDSLQGQMNRADADIEQHMKHKPIEQYQARRHVSEALSEFELAAAFPMSPNQIRKILNLCRL